MAVLVCDICGGKLTMGSGGIAVCDSCGMEHTKERIQEKVQEIKGTVRIDNSHMIENYLAMAQNAYGASNLDEAQSYCNKIIEIDPKNYMAWMLKGKSAGWQSTIGNIKFVEAANSFVNSINFAPQEEKSNVIEDSKNEMKNLAVALIKLRSERYEQWPDGDETQGFANDISQIINAAKMYIMSTGVALSSSEILTPIAEQINVAVTNAINKKIVPDYNNDNDSGYPSDFAFKQLLERAGYCSNLLLKSIELCDDDDESDISRYVNLMAINNMCMNARSYEYKTVQAGNDIIYGRPLYVNKYVEHLLLSDSAQATKKRENQQYAGKVSQIEARIKFKEKAEAAARFKKYWEKHADEKAKLEAESKSLAQQVSYLNAEIPQVPGTAEKANLDALISKFEAEKKALSLFKGKEKKALQEQIDALNAELAPIAAKVQQAINAINAKITPLLNRQKTIQAELTKPR